MLLLVRSGNASTLVTTMKPRRLSVAKLSDFNTLPHLGLRKGAIVDDVVVIDGVTVGGLFEDGTLLKGASGIHYINDLCPARFHGFERDRFTIQSVKLVLQKDIWVWEVYFSESD